MVLPARERKRPVDTVPAARGKRLAQAQEKETRLEQETPAIRRATLADVARWLNCAWPFSTN
jgi:hypothetical protein